jgi:hypothetical protein
MGFSPLTFERGPLPVALHAWRAAVSHRGWSTHGSPPPLSTPTTTTAHPTPCVQMRVMLQIWKARRADAFAAGWDEIRRQLSILYLRFYGTIIVGMFVLVNYMASSLYGLSFRSLLLLPMYPLSPRCVVLCFPRALPMLCCCAAAA